MLRKVSIVTLFVVVLSFSSQSEATHYDSDWVGGSHGEWDQAGNWIPAIVPDNGGENTFAVTINAGGDEVEVGLRQWRTIDQLDCYGEVELDIWPHDWQNEPVGLTLLDPNGLTNYGDLELCGENRQMEINGNVTNTAGAGLELADVEIHGDLYNLAGAIIVAELENDVEGDLQNDGTLTIIHASDLLCDSNLYNNGQINLYSGECGVDQILDNNSTGVIRGFGVLYADQLLQNKGTIYAYGGSLAISSEGPFLNSGILANYALSSLHIKSVADVNNNGTIEVNAGGGVAFDCNLINEPNATIQLLGGNLSATQITQRADANFAGFGGITGDVVIDTNAVIQLTGPTNIVGDVEIDPNATLEISDGTTLVTSHCTCNNGTIHMKGGRLIPQGGFTNNNCNIIWEPGTYTNVADFNLDGLVNFKDFADFADTWLWQATWY